MAELEGTAPGAAGAASPSPDRGAPRPDGGGPPKPGAAETGGRPTEAAAARPPVEAADPIPDGSVVLGGEDAPGPEAGKVSTEEGRDVAERVVQKRLREVQANPTGTPAETALLWYGMYQDGFNNLDDGTSMAIPSEFGGKLAVTTDDGEAFVVKSIGGQTKMPDGSVIYNECTVVGKDEPIPFSGNELANAHMKQQAGPFKENFSDASDTTQKLVGWYAHEGEGDVDITADQLTEIKDSLKPKESMLPLVIASEKDKLARKIEALPQGDSTRLQMEMQQDLLTFAQKASGDFGVIVQRDILRSYADQMQGGRSAIDAVLADTQQQAGEAESEMSAFLSRKGLSQGEIDRILPALRNPSQLAELLSDHALMEKVGDALQDGIFGEQTSKVDVLTMVDKLTDSTDKYINSLPPGLREKILEYIKTDPGKKAGWLALILLSLPVLATAIMVGAAVKNFGDQR